MYVQMAAISKVVLKSSDIFYNESLLLCKINVITNYKVSVISR